MNANDFIQLQKTEIEIMDEIHRICCEQGIRYYLIGGAAIGAVRHKGPIPWDVDIDIGMPRTDYMKFREYCLETSDESVYEYHDWTNSKNYIPPHSLLCKKGTEVKTIYSKYNKKQREYGAFVDIIPLDNAPDNLTDLKKLEKRLRLVQKIKDRKICYFYTGFKHHKLEHIIKIIISKFLFFVSVKKLNEIEEKVMMTYSKNNTGYMASMAGRYGFERETKPNWMYGKPTLTEFAGRKYFVPEHIHEFLTINYGDYMKLPPKEEQQANLNYFVYVKL